MNNMKLIISCLVFLLLFLGIAHVVHSASYKIPNHPKPLQEELLADPIKLDCGAIIMEWRGSDIDFNRVNALCSMSIKMFFPFVHARGYTTSSDKFIYKISIIPETTDYRDLNDIKYRFRNRAINREDLSGYTDYVLEYIFTTSNISSNEFNVSFAHELFHAMSHYYGVLYQHEGKNLEEKIRIDELLAEKFTNNLGLGY